HGPSARRCRFEVVWRDNITRRTAFAPALPSPLRKTAPYGRPVHRLGDCAGRSPGSRVVAQLRPAFPVAQWPSDAGSPLTVAGAAADDRKAPVSAFPLSSPT